MPLLLLLACQAPEPPPRAGAEGGEPPAEVEPDAPEDAGALTLFDTTRIRGVDLVFEMDDYRALAESTPESDLWVPGDVRITSDTEDIVVPDVGFAVKGQITFQQWPEKASLKMDFDRYVPGAEVYGVDRVALHNLSGDVSFLRESLAWYTFRGLGIPASRTAYVRLTDNGVDHFYPNNLYLLVEAHDGDFLERWFDDASGPMWEGDGDFAYPERLECDRGDCTDTTALLAVADAVEDAPDDTFVAEVGAYLDWDAFFRFWAAEAMVQQGDGYTGNLRNFRIYWEPTQGKFHLLPWSLDLTFYTPDALNTAWLSPLATRCMEVAECRDGFHAALLDVADDWEALDVPAELDRARDLLAAEGLMTQVAESEYVTIRAVAEGAPDAARAYVEAGE